MALTILWKFDLSQHITCLWYIVWRNDGPCPGPRDWFFSVTYLGIDNMSNLSLFNCRLFSVGCMHFPHVQKTIPISQHKVQSGHCLFEEISWNSHLSNQILWFLTEMVHLLRILSLSATYSCLGDFQIVQLIVSLFLCDSSPPVQQGMWNAWDSKIYTTTATGLPVLMIFVLTIIGFSQIRDKYILLSVLRVRHKCYAR